MVDIIIPSFIFSFIMSFFSGFICGFTDRNNLSEQNRHLSYSEIDNNLNNNNNNELSQ